MNIGMLWFDNDPKSGLSVKIERAAAYYRGKYGRTPTVCFVHPSMLTTSIGQQDSSDQRGNDAPIVTAGVEVRTTRSVLPNHFWIGVNSANATNG